ncbi:MAG: hypothetical protein V4510_04765 [bacterium]
MSIVGSSKKKETTDEVMDRAMKEWVFIPIVIAVIAIVAVGILLALVHLENGLPRWVYGLPGIPAVLIYYAIKLRHLWNGEVKPSWNASFGGQVGSQRLDRGSVAPIIKGKGNTTNIIMQGTLATAEPRDSLPAHYPAGAVFRVTDVSAARWEHAEQGRTLAFNFEAINSGTAGSAPHEVEVYWPGHDHQKRAFSGRVLSAASHNLNGGLLLPAGDRATFTAHVKLPNSETPPARRAFLVVRPVRGLPTDPFGFEWP